MRQTLRMPNADSVAAGQTATFKLPLGKTYHSLSLTYSGVTLAQMKELRLVANGSIIQRYGSGTFVDDFNQFQGLAAAAGVLRIPIGDRPNMRTKDGEELTAIGTAMVDPNNPQNILTSLNLEIDIEAAAVAPAFSMKAEQSESRILGLIKNLIKFTYDPGAAGEFQISDLPKKGLISRIIIDDSAAGVNSVKIERDQFVVFERVTAENEQIQTDGKRVPQAGYWIYDPTELGYSSENLVVQGVQDFRLTLDMAAGGSLPVYVEYLRGVPN